MLKVMSWTGSIAFDGAHIRLGQWSGCYWMYVWPANPPAGRQSQHHQTGLKNIQSRPCWAIVLSPLNFTSFLSCASTGENSLSIGNSPSIFLRPARVKGGVQNGLLYENGMWLSNFPERAQVPGFNEEAGNPADKGHTMIEESNARGVQLETATTNSLSVPYVWHPSTKLNTTGQS